MPNISDLTDLTGTTWRLNNTVSITSQASYSVNIEYDDYEFESFNLIYSLYQSETFTGLQFDFYDVLAVDQGTTRSTNNEIFTITGGTDATKSALISWVQSNATQVVSGGSMTIGNSSILKAYIGNTEIDKIYTGNIKLYERTAPVSTIEFTISTYSATYQAESGMTWTQWVASDYNTGGYSIVYHSQIGRGGDIVGYQGTAVFAGDEIVANRVYSMISGD